MPDWKRGSSMKNNPRLSRDELEIIRIYYILNLLFYIHQGFIGATYALFFYSFGISKFLTNVLSSLFMVSVFVMEIPTGAYGDAFGYRKALILAGVFLSLSMAIFSFGNTPWAFGIAQLLWGLSFAFESGTLDAWMVNNSYLTGPELDKIFVRSDKINNLSMIVSGLLGGYLASVDLALPWRLSAVSSMLYVLIAALCVDDKIGGTGRINFREGLGKISAIVKDSADFIFTHPFLKYILTFNMILSFCFSPVFVYWSPYLNRLSGEGFWVLGWIWVFIKLANLLGNFILEKLPKTGNYRLKILFSAVAWVSAIIFTASLYKHFITVLLLFLAFEVFLGVIQPLQKGCINEALKSDERATLLSLDSMLSRAANFLSLVVMGLIADFASMETTWLISALALLPNLVIIKVLAKHHP